MQLRSLAGLAAELADALVAAEIAAAKNAVEDAGGKSPGFGGAGVDTLDGVVDSSEAATGFAGTGFAGLDGEAAGTPAGCFAGVGGSNAAAPSAAATLTASTMDGKLRGGWLVLEGVACGVDGGVTVLEEGEAAVDAAAAGTVKTGDVAGGGGGGADVPAVLGRAGAAVEAAANAAIPRAAATSAFGALGTTGLAAAEGLASTASLVQQAIASATAESSGLMPCRSAA